MAATNDSEAMMKMKTKTKIKIKNMATNRPLARLSLIPLAVTIGLSATTGCDSDPEGDEEELTDYQAAGSLDRPPREMEYFPDDVAERIVHKLGNDHGNFIKPLSHMAHYLGYGWVGGNKDQIVGEDMIIETSENEVVFYGNSEGDCEGFWCDRPEKKAKITANNFRFVLDRSSLQAENVHTEPNGDTIVLTGMLVNRSDRLQSFRGVLSTTSEFSWSKTNGSSISESVSVEGKLEFPGTGSISVTVGGETSESWSETNGGSSVETVSGYIEPEVGPMKALPFRLELQKSEVSYDYTAKAQIAYDVTMSGFMRHAFNCNPGSEGKREDRTWTFAVGYPTNDRSKDVDYQWGQRDINEDHWLWEKAITKYGHDNVEWAAAESIRPTMVQLKGTFRAESGYEVNVNYDPVIDLEGESDPSAEPEVDLEDDGAWEWEPTDGPPSE